MTLYELLGALPNDDAEGLRTAFRRAVKGAHPDIRPGDPDAAWKFRRIVRAHEILGDAEQRAAYDHLLDLAHIEEASANGQATAARIHKLASGVIALAAASVVTVGGYMLFMHLSPAMLAPADKPAMHASASVGPATPPPDTSGKGASLAKDESAGIPFLLKPASRTPPSPTPKPRISRRLTHLFVAGDKYLDSDVVFGVKDSLIRELRQLPAGTTVAGRTTDRPGYHLDYDFILKGQATEFSARQRGR